MMRTTLGREGGDGLGEALNPNYIYDSVPCEQFPRKLAVIQGFDMPVKKQK